VNVMVAAGKAEGGRVDPAGELDVERGFRLVGNRDFAAEDAVFRSATVLERELARREQERLAVGTIDVRLEEEVGSEPFGLRRIDMTLSIAHEQTSDGRSAVVIGNFELHARGGPHVEQNRRLAAKAEVLVALLDIEADRRFAFAGLVRIDESDRVLDLQAAEFVGERRSGEHLDREEAVFVARRVLVLAQSGLLLALHREVGHAGIDGTGLRAGDAEPLRAGAFIDDLEEHRGETAMLKRCRRGTAEHLDARFGIDGDRQKDVLVERALNRRSVALFHRGRKRRRHVGRQRATKRLKRLDYTTHIGCQGLPFDRDHGQVRGVGGVGGQLEDCHGRNQNSGCRHLSA
jgi:hypothetical protein